nr:unnamed protein product [Digitaria exilis]
MGKNGSVKRSGSAGGSGAAAGPPSFTVNPGDYRLMEEVGYGAHAVVYRAIFLPRSEVVAVKCLDLDQLNNNIDELMMDEIQREAQIMSLIDHPNVIRAYCSFVVEHSLWVIMPFMTEGSCLHLMKISYQDGFDEPVIGSILKETLKALEYLHRQGQIHRDVKAGNILIDGAGIVKLGDFGVSACMFDRGDRQRSRNTFVGTPCWMAPEVLQPGTGYNFKADIWSFGITALELAHGHAPFSKYPPMKVLLMTLQNAPPGLDYERDKRFSKLKDAAQLALKKMPSSEQEALSLSEYQRGVSAWNFDIEDLKAQASLIRDDEPPEIKEDEDTARNIEVEKDQSSRNHFWKSSANDSSSRDAMQMICDKQRSDIRKTSSLSGPLSLPTRASANSLSAPIRSSGVYVDSSVDKSKRNVVEIKGRFSVTSENGSLIRKSASASDCLVNSKPMCNPTQLKELCNSSVSSAILIPHLNNLVQQTMFQQDLIMNLLSSLQQNEKVDGSETGISSQIRSLESDKAAETASSEKERSLLVKISELQSRMITLTDELIAAKLKHAQLQQELNALYCREEIEDVREEDNEET